jgi:hypothetical protein
MTLKKSVQKNLSQFYAKALQRAIGAPLERPLVACYTEKTYNQVDYDPRHIVPFLVDMFLASPKGSNVAWYGARAETLKLFSRAWRNCGFTGRILVADPITGEDVLAELGIDLVEHSTLLYLILAVLRAAGTRLCLRNKSIPIRSPQEEFFHQWIKR